LVAVKPPEIVSVEQMAPGGHPVRSTRAVVTTLIVVVTEETVPAAVFAAAMDEEKSEPLCPMAAGTPVTKLAALELAVEGNEVVINVAAGE